MHLVGAATTSDNLVKEKSSWIQASFLIGWALGGACFGRVGDLLGRSRALCLTILTYALFTGLSFLATEWWHLLIFRFLAALGVGGEWAIGSALLSETWPKRWRPWIAAVLQTGVNLGILLATATAYSMKGLPERYVFLVGIVPALVVYWIRRQVPEPVEWQQAREQARHHEPKLLDLFRGEVRRTTILAIIVCATSLSGWWAFMFWYPQHILALPELGTWTMEAKRGLVAKTFFWVILISILGNYVSGGLARWLGYRKAMSLMFAGFVATFVGAFVPHWDYQTLTGFWLPFIGFWSGLFGLFTMYLPPLFPTLLRTTGAGFCYNIGRLFSAFATIYGGKITAGGNFQTTLLLIGMLFIPPMVVIWWMPEPPEEFNDA